MDERPGEPEPGYPPAPAPRTEPYSVDDERVPVDDAGLEDDTARGDTALDTGLEDATRAWATPGDGGPRIESRDEPAPRRRLGWRTRRATHRPGAPARPAEGFSWGPPAETPAPDPDPAPQAPWTPAGQGPADHGPWAPQPHAPGGEQPAAAYQPTGGHPAADPARPTDAHLPVSEPWPRTDNGLPWSSPAGSADAATPPAAHATAPGAPGATWPGADAPAPAGHGAQPWQAPGQTWPAPGRWPDQPGHEAPGRRRRRGVATGVVVLLVLVALLGGIVLGALGARALWPAQTSGALPLPGSATSTDRAPESIAGIAAAALDSTVFIEVVSGASASSGSGMVLREDGYLVTNNHVIASAADGGGRVAVTFADGTQEPAEIVGRTADYDLAVLKVDLEGLTPLALADSDSLVVGDPVVAVGAPLGLEGTVTSGIISALNRPVQAGGDSGGTSFINAIQTDAAINPGNSGGPLINTAGEVIGINTAIAQAGGRQTGSIGLGFAIPSNQVRRTAEQIIETGRATYPVIGVALDTRYSGEGVQVLEDDATDTPAVTPGGPGDEAGIQPGDVITHFDGQPVTTPSELIVAVRSRAPGDTVVLTVRTGDGQEREVEVVLDEADSG